MNEYFRQRFMLQGLKTGNEAIIRLWAQLLGYGPCPKCDYIKSGCKCSTRKDDMKATRYYVISSGEDGISGQWFTKEAVEKNLQDGYWGSDVQILTELPTFEGGFDGERSIVILRDGAVVVPQKKEVKVAWVVE